MTSGNILPGVDVLRVHSPLTDPSMLHIFSLLSCVQGQLYPLVAQQAVSNQQLFPLPHTAISTPPAISSPDGHLSVFLSEARTQNSEVRMGIAKVTDKVDQVLTKVRDTCNVL
jgi:hypothetical protein